MFAWDDMRVFLMVARTLSTARAAERLKVNQSTVSRRIAALEEALGMALFERGPRGIQLKSAAERLMGLAEGALDGVPVLPLLLDPDRWLLWLGVLFILSVYFFPAGIVGRLRRK